MRSSIRIALRFELVIGVCLSFMLALPTLTCAQSGAGQTAQSAVGERNPPQKDDPLKSYLAREPSTRLPQRYAVRSGIDPGTTSHLSKGETEYHAGQSAAAVPELRQAVKESPDSYDSHYLLALTLTE